MNGGTRGRCTVCCVHFVFLLACCVAVQCAEVIESTARIVQPVSYSFVSDDNVPSSTLNYVTARSPRQQIQHSISNQPEKHVQDSQPIETTTQKVQEESSEDLPIEARTLDDYEAEPVQNHDKSEDPEDIPPTPDRGTRYFDSRTSKETIQPKPSNHDHKITDGEEFESLKHTPKMMAEEWTKDDADDNNSAEEYNKEEDEKEELKNKERLQIRSDRTLKRPKKNHLSDKKFLSKPQSFAYAPKSDQKSSASGHHHHHKGKKKKHHSEKHSKGGGKDFHSHHHSNSGKKGDKGYKGYHKYEKGKKGHHDKESHKGAYKDQKGKKKKHKLVKTHFGEHNKHEKGKKGAKFGESGEHKKGHSTKGEHNIHKKDEYLKKHEFYDEHHEGGDHEKHGGFHAQHGKKHGGKKKSGHHKSGHHEDHHGKKGHFKKGSHHEDHKGHKEAGGHDEHHSHKSEYAEKGGHKDGKKWGFSKKDKRHLPDE